MQTIQLEGGEKFGLMSPEMAEDFLYHQLIKQLADFEQYLLPDLSHISHFVSYAGGMSIERIEFVRDNRFRLCYDVPWEMNWSCAGQTESGVAKEKVHFTVSTDGHLTFLVLRTSQ